MSQHDDFSKYVGKKGKETNTYNIGWIEGNSFNRGDVSDEFIQNLWEYLKYPVNSNRGMYYNTFLDNYGDAYVACHNGYQIVLGAAEIRVLDLCRKVVYAAPDLIIHYIIDHKYLPPKEFVEAVINGPKPNSEEYSKMILDVYDRDKVSLYPSKIKCPFCGGNRNLFAPGFKKDFIPDSEIKICLYSSLSKEELVKDDDIFNVICEECGKMFQISNDDFINICKKYFDTR